MKSFSFHLILLWAFCSHVLADQVLQTNVGGTPVRTSREPKYKIKFHSEDSPYHPDDDQESVIMPDKNGQNFLCYLPKVEKTRVEKSVSQQNISSMILETEKQVKLKTPDELLEVLKGSCFIRREGWWSYEFCYQKSLKQLHLEEKIAVQEFVLGVYDAEATDAYHQNRTDISTLKDPRSKDASQRYHAHQFTNGTVCDLTKQPREAEVRFVCSEPVAMISSITEISTCKYAVTVQTPMLCKHPLFQEERPVWHSIDCVALPKDYKAEDKAADKTQIVSVTEDESSSNDRTEE